MKKLFCVILAFMAVAAGGVALFLSVSTDSIILRCACAAVLIGSFISAGWLADGAADYLQDK